MSTSAPKALVRVLRQAKKPSVPRSRPVQCIRPICEPIRSFSSTHQRRDDTSEPARKVKYTTDMYPTLKRDPRFSEITPEHVEFFKSAIGGDAVIDGVTK